MNRNALISVIVAAAVLPAAWASAAAPAADDKDAFSIQVWTIRATTKNSEISPELRDVADKLKQQFKYTGFKLEKKSSGKAALNRPYKTALIADYQAKITPTKRDKDRITLNVEVYKADVRIYNATVTISAMKFQFQGGWKLDDTDALIVAVSAR